MKRIYTIERLCKDTNRWKGDNHVYKDGKKAKKTAKHKSRWNSKGENYRLSTFIVENREKI